MIVESDQKHHYIKINEKEFLLQPNHTSTFNVILLDMHIKHKNSLVVTGRTR